MFYPLFTFNFIYAWTTTTKKNIKQVQSIYDIKCETEWNAFKNKTKKKENFSTDWIKQNYYSWLWFHRQDFSSDVNRTGSWTIPETKQKKRGKIIKFIIDGTIKKERKNFSLSLPCSTLICIWMT